MSPIFRKGQLSDIPAVARISSHSFPAVGFTLPRWEEVLTSSPRGGLDTLWVGEENGRIIAACQLYRFEQWIGGVTVPIMGLGGVTIAATARRQGIAGKMVAAALEHSAERGDVGTALYPFRTAFYQKLGYGLAGEVTQYRISPAALPDDLGRLRVTLAETPEERAELASVYDRWAALQTGQLRRTERLWEPVWENDSRFGAIYRSEAGEAEGYAIFRYLAEPPRPGRLLEIEEIGWLSAGARRGLYGWLSSLSDQWEQMLYRAHPEEHFPEYLCELRLPFESIPRWHFWFPSAVVLNGPMFRLLDVAAALGRRVLATAEALTVALEVHDAQLERNRGGFSWRISGGSSEVGKGASEGADLHLELDIETLSRIYIGSLSVESAIATGKAVAKRGEAIAILDRLLKVPRPWTFDRF